MTNMDGVKISVSNEEEESVPAEKKEPLKPKKAKKTMLKKDTVARSVNQDGQSHPSLVKNIVSIAVTAMVIGGAVYAWQHYSSGKSVEKISADARSTREELEKRLDNLKEKLSGTEQEKENLLQEKQLLEEKAQLLENAKKQYVNDKYGFSFFYPAIFGDAQLEEVKFATGTALIGSFNKNDKLVFGGVSVDYVRASTSTIIDFIDTLGFIDKKNKYYFQPAGSKESTDFEIQPAKIVGYRGGEALILDKKSFAGQDEFSKHAGKPFIEIGENLGGLLNLRNAAYKGLAFVNMDFGLMNADAFTDMLKSVEVK